MTGEYIVQEVWDDNPLSREQVNYLIETGRIRLAARSASVELTSINDPVIRYANLSQTVCGYQAFNRGQGRYAIYGHVEGFDEWYFVGWLEEG